MLFYHPVARGKVICDKLVALAKEQGVLTAHLAIIIKDKQGVRVLKVPHANKGLEKLMDRIPALVEKIKAMEL